MAVGKDIEAEDLHKRDKKSGQGADNNILNILYHFLGLLKSKMTAIPAVKMTAVSNMVS
jgi:hypothetical protein